MVFLVKKKGRTISKHRLKRVATKESKKIPGSYVIKRRRLFQRDK